MTKKAKSTFFKSSKPRIKKIKLRKLFKWQKTGSASSRDKFLVKKTKQRVRDSILILDFGSQYTQLIARRIREGKVFCQIVPYNITAEEILALTPKGIILSGGPMSVYDAGAPKPRAEIFKLGLPILGICYGLQVMTDMLGGKVDRSKGREFG